MAAIPTKMEEDISDPLSMPAEAYSVESLMDIPSPPPMEEEEEEEEPDFVAPVRNSLAFFNSRAVPVRKASFSHNSLPIPVDLNALDNSSSKDKKGSSISEWKEMEAYIKVREKAKEMELKAQQANRVETNQSRGPGPGKLNVERTKFFAESLPISPPATMRELPRINSGNNSPTNSLRESTSSDGRSSPTSSLRNSMGDKKLSNSSFQIAELNVNQQRPTPPPINLRKSAEPNQLQMRPLPTKPGGSFNAALNGPSVSTPPRSPLPPTPSAECEEDKRALVRKSSSRLFDKKMSIESGRYEDNSSQPSSPSSTRPQANKSSSSSSIERRFRRVGSNLSDTQQTLARSASLETASETDRNIVIHPYKSEDPRMLSLEVGACFEVSNDKGDANWIMITSDGKTGLYPRNYVKLANTSNVQSLKPLASASLDSVPMLRDMKSHSSPPPAQSAPPLSQAEEIKKLERTLSATSIAKDKLTPKEEKKKDKKEKEDKKKDKKKGTKKRDSAFEGDGEDEILLREGTKKVWRGATVEKIFGRICSGDDEQNLGVTIAHSWSSFLTADEVLDLLKSRAKVMSRRTMMNEDIKNSAAPIVLKIIEFMKIWLKADLPMLTQTGMVTKVKSFVEELALYQPVAANTILDDELGGLSGKSKISRTASLKWKPLKMSLTIENISSIEDIDPEELARQMTLMEHAQLANISAAEFMKQRWVKGKTEDAPVIHAMAESFNQTSGWISTLILTPMEVDQRAIMLSRWIYMAKTFYELGNFNGVLEVLSSLNSSAVFRLRKTWDLLPPKSVGIFNSLNKIMNPEFHYAAYKDALKKCHPPVVPHMGLTLTDLLLIDEGNPVYLPENNFVNIGKLELLSNNVKDIIAYARQPYSLLKHDKIQEFLSKPKHIEEERELYSMSLQREERKKKTRQE